MNKIRIPELAELKPSYVKDNKNMFKVERVYDFYIENNSLLYHDEGKIKRIRCAKNYEDKYKIFSFIPIYITQGYTIYFFLDIEKQSLYVNYGDWDIKNILIEWSEYLSNGGSYEKAVEHNKRCFDCFDGI